MGDGEGGALICAKPERTRGHTHAASTMHDHALRPRKKARVAVSEDGQPKEGTTVDTDRIRLFCFDSPSLHVETSRKLLSSMDCRLSKIVANDRPIEIKNGVPVYFAGPVATRPVLLCMLRAFATGEVIASKDATLQEVLAAIDYEAISVREVGTIPRAKGTPFLESPARGLVAAMARSGKLEFHQRMDALSRQISLAVMCWPRLESGLVAATSGKSGQLSVPANFSPGTLGFSALATRVWLCFYTPVADRVGREPWSSTRTTRQAVCRAGFRLSASSSRSCELVWLAPSPQNSTHTRERC